MSLRHSRGDAAAGFLAGLIILVLFWGTFIFVVGNFDLLRFLRSSEQVEMPDQNGATDGDKRRPLDPLASDRA